MSATATIIGRKGAVWSSIAVGSVADMRVKFKRDKFPGFAVVRYLDTSGGSRRKKGTPAKARAQPPPKK